MTVQQQAALASVDYNHVSPADKAIITDWYDRLDPLWKKQQHNFTAAELAQRDQIILNEVARDLPHFSNTPVIAEHLVISIGHMNTREGELAMCKLILASYPNGSIAARVRPITERREREHAASALAKAFRSGVPNNMIGQRADNDSDFSPLDPAP